MHDAIIGGSRAALRPREVVARSWTRTLRAGLDPGGAERLAALAPEEVERRRRRSPLHEVVDELRQVVTLVADASQMLMVITDADGVILWREGSSRVRRQADTLGFGEGAEWTEERVGTNAIGTALAEAAPVQLFSAEHFEQAQHPWYCTAAPIHDPRTGELLGIVDVSGPALTLHPTITALVQTAVRMAELQLWQRHEQRLERLRASAAPLLASTSGPLLLVDAHGWVAHASGVSAERVAVPRAERALTVPGLGLCLPEQVGGGWLVRPAGPDTRLRVTLDLRESPRIEVAGADDVWRGGLTARHAQILRALHRVGRAGLTAAQLSIELYGDADHIVTARAEVSRLRRVLGAVVETKPYRLASSVELIVHDHQVVMRADSALERP